MPQSTPPPTDALVRCPWSFESANNVKDNLLRDYHDAEWGVPLHDSGALFEFLLLDGAQAGLSWLTILRKREGYRKAFHQFNPEKIARYKEKDIERLMADAGIVRNRRKIESFIRNSRAYLDMREGGADFAEWLWNFVDGKPVVNHWEKAEDIPVSTPVSDAIARELKARGFNFCGTTIIYAFIQAAGLVNDHLVSCFRWKECNNVRLSV
jgi:DNA-3-methyladenine glycosylase I